MSAFFEKLSSLAWGGGLVALLLGAGILFTVRLGFIQLRLPQLIRRSRGECAKNSGTSQLRTVSMSLGAAMGTGNITGVAAALAAGGAGAVLWMWISAFFGMALVYAENSLSVRFSDAEIRGPMAYLSRGLGCTWLAKAFAVCCMLAAFGMGGMVQVGAVADVSGGSVSRPALAIASFVLIFSVTSGGAWRIGTAAQTLLPAAALLYAGACIAVMVRFHENIPDIFRNIFNGAFGLRPAVGGISGYAVKRAVSVGIRRGIFSNEAGLGSSPILHSAAGSSSGELQGAWSMLEVFIDTFICCTLTAAALLCASPDMSINGSFMPVLGSFTDRFICIETSVFAFCTVIGWYYCGAVSYRYLTGRDSDGLFPAVFAAFSALGAVTAMRTVWAVSDIFNALMALPNLVGLLLLRRYVNKPLVNGQK